MLWLSRAKYLCVSVILITEYLLVSLWKVKGIGILSGAIYGTRSTLVPLSFSWANKESRWHSWFFVLFCLFAFFGKATRSFLLCVLLRLSCLKDLRWLCCHKSWSVFEMCVLQSGMVRLCTIPSPAIYYTAGAEELFYRKLSFQISMLL